MDSRYPLVPMERFLAHRKAFFRIDDDSEYNLVTVQLHARGIKHRSRKFGHEIKTKRQQKIRPGDLLVAEIDAKSGGYGLVPEDAAGSIVSSHYYLYDIDESIVEPKFLEYYLKSGQPEFDIQQFVQGSLNYAAIRAYQFPKLEIPLPPLAEQRRIVGKLDALTARIEQALALQEETERDLHGMLTGAYLRISEDVPQKPMAEVAPLVRRKVEIEAEETYPELGIRSFGKGTFHKPAIQGSDLGNKRIYRIEAGDLMFSNVFSWEGAIAVAKPEDHGRYGSHRFISRMPEAGVVTAKFLYFHFISDVGLQQIQHASPGSAGRNRTLGLGALDALEVPVPPYDKQLWFDEVYDRADALRQRQAEVQVELNAILPAALDRAFRGELQ